MNKLFRAWWRKHQENKPEPPVKLAPSEMEHAVHQWGLSRPPILDAAMQLELARQARIARQAAQFEIDRQLKKTTKPDRILRYLTVMAKQELFEQQAHLERTKERVAKLEAALTQLERELGPEA